MQAFSAIADTTFISWRRMPLSRKSSSSCGTAGFRVCLKRATAQVVCPSDLPYCLKQITPALPALADNRSVDLFDLRERNAKAERVIETSSQYGVGGDVYRPGPVRGDALLKRMLQTKPKPHQDMIAERKAKTKQGGQHEPKRK